MCTITAPNGIQIPIPFFVMAKCTKCGCERQQRLKEAHERRPGHHEYSKGVLTTSCYECGTHNIVDKWHIF